MVVEVQGSGQVGASVQLTNWLIARAQYKEQETVPRNNKGLDLKKNKERRGREEIQ